MGFFDDIFAMSEQGPEMINMFLVVNSYFLQFHHVPSLDFAYQGAELIDHIPYIYLVYQGVDLIDQIPSLMWIFHNSFEG